MVRPYKCVIVANGSFPSSPVALEMMEKASVIVACDGAVEALHARGYSPDAIVGDMDSIPHLLRHLYADRIYVEEDQEENDLTKAVHYVQDSGEKDVLILGATGLREDHTLGNISLLADYALWMDHVEMLTDYGLFTPLLKSSVLKSWPGQQISIFAIYPEGEITVEKLRYPITNRVLTSWWQGSLNEALEDTFTIHLSPQARVIIFREIKKDCL